MALPQSKYIIQALFNGNEQNIARDGVFDTAKAQALDYNKLAAEVKDIADDLLKAANVIPKLNIEQTIIDLNSRITTSTGAGDVEVLRVPADHANLSDALVAAEASTTKYTIILVEAVVPAGAQAVTVTKPTKFIGTSDIAEIDFGATKVIVDFPATSEQAHLEFQDLKISRSDTAEAFDIVGNAVIRFSNCVITDDVVAAPTFAMFEAASGKTLEVFISASLLQTTNANGLLFKSGSIMTIHLDDTNANNTTNSGTIFDGGAGLTLNMSNHSFIDQVTVTTTAFTLTYDGTSIYVNNSTLTSSSKTIHGVAYYDTRMTGLNVRDAIQHSVKPTTGGRKLVIGPGTYLMSTAATIAGTGPEVQGSGPGTILKVTAGTEALTISGTNVIVSNLQIQLDGAGLRGITITTGARHNIHNIFFDNISGSNTDFLRITGGSDILIDKCIGKITSGSVGKFFFGDVGSGRITVSNCIANGMLEGFRTDIAKTIFDACQAKSAGGGNLFSLFADDCVMSDCIGEGNGTANLKGISVNGDRIRIDNCNLKDMVLGIDIAATLNDIAISGGTIKLISTAVAVVGIRIFSATTITVSNVIIDGNGNADVGSNGLEITGSTVKMSLLGIKVRDLTAGNGISYISSGPTFVDSTISNCRIETIGGIGIHVKNTNRITITSNHIRASGSDNIRLEIVLEAQVSTNHCSGSVAGFGINETGAANFNLIGTNHCRGNSSGAVNVVGANSVESDTMS